jgi:hypothetical protein
MRTVKIVATDADGVILDIATVKIPPGVRGLDFCLAGPGRPDNPRAVGSIVIGAGPDERQAAGPPIILERTEDRSDA